METGYNLSCSLACLVQPLRLKFLQAWLNGFKLHANNIIRHAKICTYALLYRWSLSATRECSVILPKDKKPPLGLLRLQFKLLPKKWESNLIDCQCWAYLFHIIRMLGDFWPLGYGFLIPNHTSNAFKYFFFLIIKMIHVPCINFGQ